MGITVAEEDIIYKFFAVRFSNMDDYNFALGTVKDVANNSLKNGEKINLSDALTKIIREWDIAKRHK